MTQVSGCQTFRSPAVSWALVYQIPQLAHRWNEVRFEQARKLQLKRSTMLSIT